MKQFCTILGLLFMFFTSALPAAAAQWEGVFEGTIGKAKVLVELNAGYEKSDYKGGYSEGGRYSYLPKVRDINLMLDAEGDTLKFTETLRPHRMFADEEDKKITGSWVITVDAKGATGTWTSPKGDKTLPITLVRTRLLPVAEVGSLTNRLSATYEEAWLKTVAFTDAGIAKKFLNVDVRYVKDSAFGTLYPVLGKFRKSGESDKINMFLLAKHRQSVREYRECFNGVPVDWSEAETERVISYDITYASQSLLSYTESGSVFCGGAHPNNYVNPQTFLIDPPVQIGGGPINDLSAEGFGRILKIEHKVQRIAFEKFAFGTWKEAASKDKEMGNDCGTGLIDETADGEKDFKLSLTKKGLAVWRTDYPHVASVCLSTSFNPTIIPYRELKPWLHRKNGIIAFEDW